MKSALNCLLAASRTVRASARASVVGSFSRQSRLTCTCGGGCGISIPIAFRLFLFGDLLIPIDHFLHFNVGSGQSGGGQKSASLAPVKTCMHRDAEKTTMWA